MVYYNTDNIKAPVIGAFFKLDFVVEFSLNHLIVLQDNN